MIMMCLFLLSGDLVKCLNDIGAPLGSRIVLDKVLCVGGQDFTLFGRPLLPQGLVRVEATVIERGLCRTKISQKFKKRENFRKVRFSREQFTLLRIHDVNVTRKVD